MSDDGARRVEDAENEIRRLRSQLVTVERLAQVGSWEYEFATDTTRASEELAEIVGLSREALAEAGRETYLARVHPEDRALVERMVARARTESALEWEHRIVLPSGSVRVIRARVQVMRGPDGEPERLIGVDQDVTEERATQERLRTAQRDAERASEAKGEFIARMSHELRTPLNSVLASAQLLSRQHLPAPHRAHVGRIIEGGRHLLGVIDEVLDLARVESGHVGIRLEHVNLYPVIETARGLIHPLAADRGIEPEVIWEDGTSDSCVMADRQRLSEVLLNLLSNAVKYNREHGALRIRVREAPDHRIQVLVEDEGEGIASDALERVFEPFERLEADLGGATGTGLGLPLARRLVQAMSGTLELQSEPGAGSCFTLTLPRVAADARIPRPELEDVSGNGEAGSNGRAKVLYIEDNVMNVDLMMSVLAEIPGLELVATPEGMVGIERAAEHQPDLILLDLHLADVAGDHVLERLKEDERTRHIPVMVLTADALGDAGESLLAAGASAYFTKPFDVHRLLATVEGLLDENGAAAA